VRSLRGSLALLGDRRRTLQAVVVNASQAASVGVLLAVAGMFSSSLASITPRRGVFQSLGTSRSSFLGHPRASVSSVLDSITSNGAILSSVGLSRSAVVGPPGRAIPSPHSQRVGLLIQTASGKRPGVGTPCGNRSGCAA